MTQPHNLESLVSRERDITGRMLEILGFTIQEIITWSQHHLGEGFPVYRDVSPLR